MKCTTDTTPDEEGFRKVIHKGSPSKKISKSNMSDRPSRTGVPCISEPEPEVHRLASSEEDLGVIEGEPLVGKSMGLPKEGNYPTPALGRDRLNSAPDSQVGSNPNGSRSFWDGIADTSPISEHLLRKRSSSTAELLKVIEKGKKAICGSVKANLPLNGTSCCSPLGDPTGTAPPFVSTVNLNCTMLHGGQVSVVNQSDEVHWTP